jgi:hypothetical protein
MSRPLRDILYYEDRLCGVFIAGVQAYNPELAAQLLAELPPGGLAANTARELIELCAPVEEPEPDPDEPPSGRGGIASARANPSYHSGSQAGVQSAATVWLRASTGGRKASLMNGSIHAYASGRRTYVNVRTRSSARGGASAPMIMRCIAEVVQQGAWAGRPRKRRCPRSARRGICKASETLPEDRT